MRKLKQPYKAILYILGIAIILWSFLVLTFLPVDPLMLRVVHLAIAMVMVFMAFPATKQSPPDRPTIIDLAWCIIPVFLVIYTLPDFEDFQYRTSVATPTQIDLVLGVALTIAVLEGVRRVAGNALVVVALLAIGYAFFGKALPGSLGHRGYQMWRIIATIFSEEGILGAPVQIAATYALLFVTFGSFLARSGVSDFFNEFAYALLGGKRGGPAKVAVLASGLFGMVSGHAAANVATTGTITIPMMKKIGYKPEFAGAVEAAASAGGQFMPPVLGAVVFLMVALTGIEYRDYVIVSVFPAVIYYLYVFFNVDFEAGNLGLQGLPRSELPPLWPILKRQAYLIVPVPVLVYTLVIQQAPIINSVVWSIFASVLAGYLNSYVNKKKYMGPRQYADAVYGGSVVIRITAVTAAAGIIIGMIMMTGVGVKLGGILFMITGGNFHLTLLLAAALSIILGCGMPALPAYVITAAVMAPVLGDMGIPKIVVHYFIFMFSSLSTITPPVAISAYTGAGIAEADPLRTALQAVKIAGIGWVVPFMMVYSPPLAMNGTPLQIAAAVIPTVIGGYAMARGLVYRRVPKPARVVLFVGGVMGVIPGYITDILGMIVIACGFLFERWLLKHEALKEEEQVRIQPTTGA
jgi:TRAP transporter 4TM/12TM fusion protein